MILWLRCSDQTVAALGGGFTALVIWPETEGQARPVPTGRSRLVALGEARAIDVFAGELADVQALRDWIWKGGGGHRDARGWFVDVQEWPDYEAADDRSIGLVRARMADMDRGGGNGLLGPGGTPLPTSDHPDAGRRGD